MAAQRHYLLDRSSIRFPEQLDELLHDRQWVEAMGSLPEGELQGPITYLDNVLDGLDPTGSQFRDYLHVLQRVCGTRAILPSGYEVAGGISCTTPVVAFGASSDVYHGSLGLTNVCIKRLRITSTDDQVFAKQALCKEAVVWKRLVHPNIVVFKGVTFEPLQLVSEWVPGEVLREYIRENCHANLVGLLLGVAEGLGYLHSRNVIHGDIKGANILVDADGNAKIVDFGLSTVFRGPEPELLTSTSVEHGFPARYVSPEILKGVVRHSKESDVFAFGMVVIEVFTGKVPFITCAPFAAKANILTGERPERPVHHGFTDHLWTTTQKCWEEKPEDRIRMDSVIKQLKVADQVAKMISPVDLESYKSPLPKAVFPLGSYGLTLFPSFPPIPQAPLNFLGRSAVLEDLLNFAERSASLTLFGPAGIGKTATALTLLHHNRIASKFGAHRHFIACDYLQNSVDSFLSCLFEAIGAPRPADMTQFHSCLETVPPCILVFDGVDSILDPRASEAAEIATVIEELSQHPGICLLATSRMNVKIPDFRHVEVSTLPQNVARGVFYGHCGLGRSAAIDGLLAELDFHPLSITLLAAAVSNHEWDEPALLEAWENGKTNTFDAHGFQSLQYTIESVLLTPTIQELGSVVRKTLEAIAAFPDGTKEVKLESTFPRIDGVGEAVNALCKFSLLYREDGFVKMLAPFRLYFFESPQTPVYHDGSGPAYEPIEEENRYTRQDPRGFGQGNSVRLSPKQVTRLLRSVHGKPEKRYEQPLGGKLAIPGFGASTNKLTKLGRPKSMQTSGTSLLARLTKKNEPPKSTINVGSGKPYSVVGMPHKLLEQPSQELINELDKESRPKYPDHDNSQQSTQMLENGEVSLEDRSHVLNVLGKMCRDLKTIPDSTHIEDCFGLANERHGGSASVSHGIYRGRKVAVKSVHLYITSDYDERFGKFRREVIAWRHLRHQNILPLIGVNLGPQRLAMVSEWMDHGNINEFIKNHEGVNRIQLLIDAANGLEYMHGISMVHGDLKGANILVNQQSRACLADFGLSTIVGVERRNNVNASMISVTSKASLLSFTGGGTIPWMSPELLYPEHFGITDCRPTKQSDCYAFAMVIYEVLCGKIPYPEIRSELGLVPAVLRGARPGKPDKLEDFGFTTGLWKVVKRCWLVDAWKRPDVKGVLFQLNHAA